LNETSSSIVFVVRIVSSNHDAGDKLLDLIEYLGDVKYEVQQRGDRTPCTDRNMCSLFKGVWLANSPVSTMYLGTV